MSTRLAAAPRINFLGVPLLQVTTSEFIDLAIDASGHDNPSPAMITYINAWCMVIARRDANYRALLQQSDGLYADGQAIVWAAHFLGWPIPERVNAADFIVEFCRRAAASGRSIYLLGSAPGVAASAAAAWSEQIPGLKIAGTQSGYFSDDESVLQSVNAAAPDILLVGMGVPRQEKWVTANRERISAKLIWCIGAMFEYHGKARARAPVWMRRAGLEWLFRLALEPRRLAQRYLVGNVLFLFYVLEARFRGTRKNDHATASRTD